MYFVYVFLNFMDSSVSPACMSVHHVGALCRRNLEEDIRSTGVTGGCEVPCGFWKSNKDPLKDQPVVYSLFFCLF